LRNVNNFPLATTCKFAYCSFAEKSALLFDIVDRNLEPEAGRWTAEGLRHDNIVNMRREQSARLKMTG